MTSPPVMLVVLGVHRSGTSAATRSMECLGAVPSRRLHEPLPNNPTGFFEDLDVQRLNEYELLPALGSHWSDIKPPKWGDLDTDVRSRLIEQARQILLRNFDPRNPLSVLKDPRLGVLFPFWREALGLAGYEVRVVYVVRDPLSVARSLQHRDGLSIAQGCTLYVSNWLTMLEETCGLQGAFLLYDELLTNPRGALARVAGRLGLPIHERFDSCVSGLEKSFLDPGLRHSYAAGRELRGNEAVPTAAITVYDELVAAAANKRDASTVWAALSDTAASTRCLLPALEDYDRLFHAHRELGQEAVNLRDEVRGLRDYFRKTTSPGEVESWGALGLPPAAQHEVARLEQSLRDQAAGLANLQERLEQSERRAHLLTERLEASEVHRRALEADVGDRDRRVANVEQQLAREGVRARRSEQRLAAVESSRAWRLANTALGIARFLLERSPGALAAMRDVRRSGLFDAAFYLATQGDVRDANEDPLRHFLRQGGSEGRRPSPLFDCRFYLSRYPDVQASGVNPLLHYIRHGKREGRLPHASRAQDAREAPLSREIRLTRESGLLDSGWYLAQHGDVRDAGMDPSEHYVLHGWKEGRDPSPWFNTSHYVRAYRAGKLEGRNPLLHYLEEGYSLGNLPGPNFLQPGPRPLAEGGTARSQLQLAPASPREALPANGAIVFVGCDGLVAGSQVLLLSLVQWLHRHTSVRIDIVLLSGGPLVPRYEECGRVLIWQDFVRKHPAAQDRQRFLLQHLRGAELIYGNTVVAATLYEELTPLRAPFISHIHELERSMALYASPAALKAMRRLTSAYIGCSPPVSANLMERHHALPEKVQTIHAFIAERPARAQSREAVRRRLGLPLDRFLVVGCGTIYWRKGPDLFVDAAIRLCQAHPGRCHFAWIGNDYWDEDPASRSLTPWQSVVSRITEAGLADSIAFLGAKSDPTDHFAAADVFFLPSREDPFPLVCLEAAQAGTPIVCFAGGGGIPEFVGDDAGIVVRELRADAAADALEELLRDDARREALGQSAALKVRGRHTDNMAVPRILEACHRAMGRAPLVSVIVPVYNHERFLAERLDSILAQTFRDFEVIILDDASSDGSDRIARRYQGHPQVRVVTNTANSGSAFRQWRKGIGLARGDLVWIAEGDDACDPAFLAELLPFFSDPDVAIAYSDSVTVDEQGRATGTYSGYYDALDLSHWKMDYVVPAETEISFGLGAKNTIPNASAAIFRRRLASAEILDSIESMRFSGDWFFHVQLLKGRKIAFRSRALNRHRKHDATLTTQFNRHGDGARALLDEAARIHGYVLDNYHPGQSLRPRLAAYIAAQVEGVLGSMPVEEHERHYPVSRTMAAIERAIAGNAPLSIRVAFVTTGDAAHDGGAEQLWIQTAIRMATAGASVLAVIKRWSPEPYFFSTFRQLGITLAFKDDDAEGCLERFRPDLAVINIGDQDEGASWYTLCRDRGIRYAIVNHLTKEPAIWPIRHDLIEEVRLGNTHAEQVFFTSRNNRLLQERRLGCPIRRADLFHNPLFIDRSRSLPFPDSSSPLRLAMPARMLNIHKGQDLALRVFAKEKWRTRGLELHLYGNGPDEVPLKAFAQAEQLTHVFFHNPNWQLPKPDMEAIWRHCHALLMTSHMEGMPIVLLNAMFHGRVPIVTDVGGHREVIEDGDSGFIAGTATEEAIDEALERAWQRRHEWEQIGHRARARMLCFSPEDPVGEMVDKLRALATNGRRAADCQGRTKWSSAH